MIQRDIFYSSKAIIFLSLFTIVYLKVPPTSRPLLLLDLDHI